MESLSGIILVLLRRCMLDTEDVVRERATYYHAVLNTKYANLISKYILNPPQVRGLSQLK